MRNIFLFGVAAVLFVACDKPTEPTPVVVATPTEMLSSVASIASGNVVTYGAAKTTIDANLAELNIPCQGAIVLPNLPTLAGLNVESLATLNPMQITQEFTQLATQTIVANPGENVSSLATGILDYTAGCLGLVKTPSEDYIMRWKTKSGKVAELIFDWDGSSTGSASPTIKQWQFAAGVGSAAKNVFTEMPTKLRASFTVAGAKIAEAALDYDYRKHATIGDAFVGTPNSVDLKFLANTLAGAKLLDVSASLNIDAAGVRTTGTINANHNSDSMAASWDLNIAGTPTFDINNNISGFAFVGASTVKAALSQNAKTMDVSFGFNSVSPANLLGAKLVSAVITDGVINVEGKKVTFSGTLNDANANCVYGDAVNVQFKAETKTLEKLLLDSNMAKTCLRP